MSFDKERLKNRFVELSKPLEPITTGVKPLIKKLDGIQFVIFDFYGTLFISGVGDIGVDEEDQNIEDVQNALEACGFKSDPETAENAFRIYNRAVARHKEKLIARGLETPEPDIQDVWLDVLQKLNSSKARGKTVDSKIAGLFSVEFEARMNPVWPMPGLHETLDILRKRDYTLGIISNSQFYTPIAFEALAGKTLNELGFNMELLHWSFEEHLKKPSLKFYSGFVDKLKKNFPDTAPSSVLYIGNDMLKDIYPAASVGMKTALFAGDQRSLKWREDDERCRLTRPDLIITELKQIPDCI